MAEITLRQLRSLVVLAEELHFRRAAARLHLTQPALSHQIKQLEEQVGVSLLDRTGRRVNLNPAGASLTADAVRLLAELDRAVGAARHAGAALLPLHICHSPSISRILIPPIIGHLRGGEPELDVVWIERSEEGVGLELLSGRYDLVLGRFPPPDPGIKHEVCSGSGRASTWIAETRSPSGTRFRWPRLTAGGSAPSARRPSPSTSRPPSATCVRPGCKTPPNRR